MIKTAAADAQMLAALVHGPTWCLNGCPERRRETGRAIGAAIDNEPFQTGATRNDVTH